MKALVAYNHKISIVSNHLSVILFTLFLCFFFFVLVFLFKIIMNVLCKGTLPINWPVLGMWPTIVQNWNRQLLFITDIQLQAGGSFMVKGPWFSKMELFCTADPANLQHIMSKCYSDFHKGSKFNEIFDVLGDGIFNTDGQCWQYQRKIALDTFTNPYFRCFMVDTLNNKLNNAFIPFLERVCNQELVVDLQDLFIRLTSDVSYITITGHDPVSLSPDLLDNPVSHHMHIMEEIVFLRHAMPGFIWKLQRRLGFGNENILKKSQESVDHILIQCITKKREEVDRMKKKIRDPADNGELALRGEDDYFGKDLLTHYILQNYGTPDHGFVSTTKFLRDTLVTLLLAGQDSTSIALAWFFWLLSKNPEVEIKIKQELQEKINKRDCGERNISNNESPKEEVMKNLVYLHASICESLRLYPSVPFNHKASYKPVVLPSGHKVKPSTSIMLNCYAMGRMKSIWGDDCLEFKPERWITKQGTIKHVPSYKFFAFNAGPRICLGKEMALMQMKTIIVTIFLRNFRIQVTEGQCVEPCNSIILSMKHGLKVRVYKDLKHNY